MEFFDARSKAFRHKSDHTPNDFRAPCWAGDLCTSATTVVVFDAEGGMLVPTGGTFRLRVSTVMPGVVRAGGAMATIMAARGGVRISTGLRVLLRVSKMMPASDSVSVTERVHELVKKVTTLHAERIRGNATRERRE